MLVETVNEKLLLKHFHTYIYGVQFTVVTDHIALSWLNQTPVADWRDGLCTFKCILLTLCTGKVKIIVMLMPLADQC